MNPAEGLDAAFNVPLNHTPKVMLTGGTDFKNFSKVWADTVPEEKLKDMDENSSKNKVPLHPVMVLIVQGGDGHVHAQISLPLQEWSGDLVLEESVSDSKDLRRLTDWCAGFMEVFCFNGTVAAHDLDKNEVIFGTDSALITELVSAGKPRRSVPSLESIGSVEDILGQLGDKEIEEMKRIPVKDESPEEVKVPVENKAAEERKKQQEVADKYGFPALKELLEKMKQPLLIEEPKV